MKLQSIQEDLRVLEILKELGDRVYDYQELKVALERLGFTGNFVRQCTYGPVIVSYPKKNGKPAYTFRVRGNWRSHRGKAVVYNIAKMVDGILDFAKGLERPHREKLAAALEATAKDIRAITDPK